MPAVQDAVHIAPLKFLEVEEGPVAGQEQQLVGKAQTDPALQIVPLLGHGGAALAKEELKDLGPPAVQAAHALEVGVGGVQGGDAGLFPLDRLPADQGQGGGAAGAAFFGFFVAPARQGQDDLRGQAQEVIDHIQNFQVGRGEDLSQQMLHGRDQRLEFFVVHGLGDVLAGVLRGPLVGQLHGPLGGHRRVRAEQAQLDEGAAGGLHPLRAPGERPAGLARGQTEIEQGGVAVAGFGQLFHCLAVQADDIAGQKQVFCHGQGLLS